MDIERGASLVEYGLLLGLIAVIAIVAVKALGPASRPSSRTSRRPSTADGDSE